MPGGDRTGPIGGGARKGRGIGFCTGFFAPGYTNPMSGRGMGYGRGFGRGAGMGRGRGRGFGWRSAGGYGYVNPGVGFSAQDEAQMLKDQVQFMENEMNALNSRIKELESQPASGEPIIG